MNVNGVTSAATQAGAATQSAKAASDVTSDFETFLQLLTAQMRNQDPLNPMDSTAFVAQLAEFSGVEQQVKANDTLAAILEAVSGGGSGQLADLVGKQVQAETLARFEGDPVEIAFEPDAEAVSAQLIVRNADGEILARLPSDPAASSILWDGKLEEGVAEEGVYRLSQARVGADGLIEEAPGRVFAEVTELRIAPGGALLALDTGEAIPESAITAIRG